jgi:hypothetical protein
LDPNILGVAREAKVSRTFVVKVVEELEDGGLVDPEMHLSTTTNCTGVCGFLDIEHELFILGLRAENPARSNQDYCNNLRTVFGVEMSTSSVSNFFLKRFDHAGNFRKAVLVPLDKWRVNNKARYFEFMYKVRRLSDHTRWVFFDEKHLVNKDTLPGKVRANPLTGHVDSIGVSGDFRDAFNLLAAISCNPAKPRPMVYSMGKKNGDAESYMAFIRRLIVIGWLQYGDVACMDNARIHTGGEAIALEGLLWNYEVNGRPLNILTVFLPTRSPELNPIELVFHILTRRVRSYRVVDGGRPCDTEVVRYASQVMDDISLSTIAKCYVHDCGY